MLSMTSNYRTGTGCPAPALRRIADAGFTHVHWGHQWHTDFLYDPAEIRQIGRWLKDYGLALLNLHGSHGQEKCWWSPRDSERRAGVALVRNRLHMAARLGADVVIIHTPGWEPEAEGHARQWAQLHRSLDALAPIARGYGVRLAIENMPNDDFRGIDRLLAAYPPEFLGLCYDSGHGNMGRDGLDALARWTGRLIAVHLHDNAGVDDADGDRHQLPFDGTVDWPRLARLLAAAGLHTVNLESIIRHYADEDDDRFLRRARDRALGVAGLLADAAHPDFAFLPVPVLTDGELSLHLLDCLPGDAAHTWLPSYDFQMRASDQAAGHITLRVGYTPDIIMYGGHIGYAVVPAFRGRHFAERACRLLFPLTAAHGLTTLWITNNPDNIPSRRTCERLGAELIEIVPLPEHNDQYRLGDRTKCRYRVAL